MNFMPYLSYQAPGQLEILRAIQGIKNPVFDFIFQWVTQLGEFNLFIIVLCIVLWNFNKKFGYRIMFIIMPVGLMNTVFKNIFRIPRPIGQEGIESLRVHTAGGYSFPSGHTMGASSFWGALMLQVKKKCFTFLCLFIMVLVAFSRMYLGVHTFLDVSAGLILGLSFTFLFNWIFEFVEKSENPWLIFLMLIPLVLFPVINFEEYEVSKNFIYSAGIMTAICLGYVIERKYIQLQMPSSKKEIIIRTVLGLGIFVVILLASSFIPRSYLFRFIQYFIYGLWMTVGAPFMFSKFPKAFK